MRKKKKIELMKEITSIDEELKSIQKELFTKQDEEISEKFEKFKKRSKNDNIVTNILNIHLPYINIGIHTNANIKALIILSFIRITSKSSFYMIKNIYCFIKFFFIKIRKIYFRKIKLCITSLIHHKIA